MNNAKHLLATAKDAVDVLKKMGDLVESIVKDIIIELQQGVGYVCFNDETGFPEWYSHYSGKSEPLVAMKVDVDNNRILVADFPMIADAEEVEDVLSDDGSWFDPEEDGELLYDGLIDILDGMC